jgi:hypothetical protein
MSISPDTTSSAARHTATAPAGPTAPASAAVRIAKKRVPKPVIVPDGRWPKMFRLRLADGSLTDMVNKARAKEVLATAVVVTTVTPKRRAA